MNKKLNKIVLALLIAAICFSLFSVGFAFSALDGLTTGVNNYFKTLPFSPVIEANLLYSYTANIIKNYSSVIHTPEENALIKLHELSIEGIAGQKYKYKGSPGSDYGKYNPITMSDVDRLKHSPYIKDVFACTVLDTVCQDFVYAKGLQMQIARFPPSFFRDLHLPLLYGRYFNSNDSTHSVIITYEASKTLFGDVNPVGKTLKGSDGTYTIIGVLKPYTDIEQSALPGDLFLTRAFGKLPADYVMGKHIMHFPNYKIPHPDLLNTLWIIPRKGYYNEAMKLVERVMKNKGNGKTLYPHIDSTIQRIKYALSAKGIEENIRNIIYAALFVLIVSVLVCIEFIILNITRKKREVSIKRSIGANKRHIFTEELHKYIFISIVSALLSLLALYITIPLFKSFNLAGIHTFLFANSVFTPLRTPFIVGKYTITFVFLTAVLAVAIALYVALHSIFKVPPALLLHLDSNTRSRFSSKAILVILTISVIGVFSISALRYTRAQSMKQLESEVAPETLRIIPQSKSVHTDVFADYTLSDYEYLKKALKDSAYIGFRKDLPYETIIPLKNDKKLTVRISEATEQFPYLYNFNISTGRFLKDKESGTCVVGSKVAQLLHLRTGSMFLLYKVVGIIYPTNPLIDTTVFVSGRAQNPNYRVVSGMEGVGSGTFLIKAKDGSYADTLKLAKEALSILNKRHFDRYPGSIINPIEEIKDIKSAALSTYIILSIFILLALLSAFLSLSALLFIEVIRRTREIGIKKAIGATAKDITKEFTMNGLTTTLIALTIGIPTGIAVSLIIEKLKGWNYYIPINILILVTIISLLLGFLFSYLPALFASKTNPVEAIKSD